MSGSQKLRRIILCAGMEMAALLGAPVRPDEIADLFRTRHKSEIPSSVRKDDEDFRRRLRARGFAPADPPPVPPRSSPGPGTGRDADRDS